MIRGNKLNKPAIMAISAAILCSSSVSFAQETAPLPTAQPAPVTVEPTPVVQTAPEVAPPVATVAPTPAASPIPESAAEQRVESAPAPAAAARAAPSRTATSQSAMPRVIEALPAIDPVFETTANADVVPVSEDIAPVDVAVGDTDALAPLNETATTELADGTQEDWIIYGGLAAALGLAGLGGVVAARRRRTRQNERRPVERTAPAPLNDYPVARPLVAQQAAPRFIQPRVSDVNLPPVTDPLFAHQAELGPITDPLFSQKIALPPVTDPMFAETEDYVGASTAGSDFDKRRTWPATPAREMEPAE